MTLEPIEHEPDDYEPHDAPARPSAARTGGFPRRFWLALTGRPTGAERCRPVTVTGDDGQPVHTTVLGAEPLSEQGQAAFGEIVRAAQRRHREELRAARQAADDDVRAVAALLIEDEADLEAHWAAVRAIRDRFADRIAELDARDTKARARTPIQGSGYTPLQLLGVVEDDEESKR